jgi:hypothetical protein
MVTETIHDRTFVLDSEEIKNLCGIGDSRWKLSFIQPTGTEGRAVTVRFTKETRLYTATEIQEFQEYLDRQQAKLQEFRKNYQAHLAGALTAIS